VSGGFATAVLIGCSVDASSGNRCSWWDTDCDNISNAVEKEPANAEYQFDTLQANPDPSMALGQPNSGGSLTGGLNYPDDNAGTYEFRPNPPGYQYFDARYDQPDSNDWGTGSLINAIEFVGRERDPVLSSTPDCYDRSVAAQRTPATRFAVGDMSKRGGGAWYHSYDGATRHGSHQNGRDVDIRYLRVDRNEMPLDISLSPSSYDTAGTLDLMECFVWSLRIDLIYVDSASLGFWNPSGQNRPLVHLSGHKSHFHVRILQP
jgi:hypothetical protein